MMEAFNLSKYNKILACLNMGIIVLLLSITGGLSSPVQAVDLSHLVSTKAKSSSLTLFDDTNPKVVKKTATRGLASEDNNKKEDTEEKEEEETESYSRLDPNLYEGGSGGASSLLQINQISDRLNQQ